MGGSPFGGAPRRPPARPTAKAPPKDRIVRASDGSKLTQRGENIYSDLRIPFEKAILGVAANVPTLTGVAKVRVPSGTSSGQKLRLKGKGAAKSPAKAGHGDHFVTIHIDVPKVEGDESRDLLAKFVKSVVRDKDHNE